MTTNYGARPGLTGSGDGVHCACGNVVGSDGVRCVECATEPLAVDGDREYWRGKVAECEREIVGLTHERDVARKACENLTAMRDDLLGACHVALAGVREAMGAGVFVGPTSVEARVNARNALVQARNVLDAAISCSSTWR